MKKSSFAWGLKFTALDVLTLALPGLMLFLGAVWSGTALAGFFTGFFLGLSVFVFWTAMLFALGFISVSKRKYAVYERFGKVRLVLFEGIGWVNPLFDRLKAEGTMSLQEVKLYQDEPGRAEMDFPDGSAPVHVKGAYSVGRLEDIEADRWPILEQAVIKYTYVYSDPVARIETILDGELRPRLQKLRMDEAQSNGEGVCEAAAAAAASKLAVFGVYQPPHSAIIVEDIDLPDSLIAAREEVQKGEKEAEAEAFRLQGPARAILAVREALNTAGFNMSDAEIAQYLLTQQGLETIGKTGANVTLVAQDVQNILKTLGIGGK